jgi:uncharacterized protein YlaN (UPF0358 family)
MNDLFKKEDAEEINSNGLIENFLDNLELNQCEPSSTLKIEN